MKRLAGCLAVLLAACGSRPVQSPPTATVQVSDLRVSGPYVHENLAVYLVHADRSDERDYLTLDEGLKNGSVVVTEKGQEQVNELLLENKSDKPLFIQEGDRVIGGKQDRIIGMSFVVPPRSGARPVPSFCVESGRWQGKDMKFIAGANFALADKDIREAAKLRKNQRAVWNRVSLTKRAVPLFADVPNLNSSLNETLEDPKVKKLCESYAAAFSNLLDGKRDAIGVAIALNGKIEEIDVYPGHGLLRKLLPRVVQSYALAAATRKESAATPTAGEVARFMDRGKPKKERNEKIDAANDCRMHLYEDAAFTVVTWDGRAVHRQWMRTTGGEEEEPQRRNDR